MKRWLLFLGMIGFLTLPDLGAQRLEQFSEDQSAFLAELGTYMTASKQKVMEENYKEFEQVFKSGLFSTGEAELIRQTANTMLVHRLGANPYFRDYLTCLMAIKKQENSNLRFQEWHGVLQAIFADMETRRLKPLEAFLDFSLDFYQHQALRHGEGAATSWYVIAEDYRLDYREEEPLITFEKLDLLASRRQDSILIFETSGSFYPVEGIWQGKGGRVTWERLGLEPDVYTELGSYELEVKKSLYEVKEVVLHYPLFFGNRTVKGSFSDKLVAKNDATEGSYPRFESGEGLLEINNLGNGIKFKGGFRLQGSTIYGYGTKDQKAELSLYDNQGRLAFTGKAELFAIKREERIVGEGVESVLYFGRDSIYHPSVNVRLDIPSREIQLSRGERGSDRNPFFNSMNRVNIEAETINAYIGGDSLVIGRPSLSISTKKDVFFESLGYFQKRDYERFQNIGSSNPLAIMKVTAEREGTNFIDANLLAQRINSKFTVENIKSLLYDLVAEGFINYDAEKQLVEVKSKVFHYANADRNQVDYDVLRIRSETRNTNAVMNFKDRSINIEGVDQIEFSNKQKVAIKPFGKEIKLLGDRNLDFDGRIFAGYSMLEGKDFHFQYDKFQVKIDSARYFDLYVPTGELDKDRNPIALSIGSRIEHLRGVLLIDAPANKSGKEDIPMFPSLQTSHPSFVFYDRDTIQEGAYGRDSFYFRLDPFSFNHLDGYTADDLRFKGTLVSAGIFPDFKETLRLRQEDQSLGFVTSTPVPGYANYQGKGNYNGTISLSNQGLLGQGTLRYLGASINSEDLIFKPDQALASAERFDLEEDRSSKVSVPQVRGEAVRIDWRPYSDSMYVRSKDAPFALYKDNKHTLKGMLILTPGGLKGNGMLDWDKATMRSELFSFGAHSVQADTTDIGIKAFDADELALKTANVNAQVDFDKQLGIFKANEQFLVTSLPYNQYVTSMNEFSWNMKEENIIFKSDKTKLGTFTSIHPDQDSLTFQGKAAFYDLKTSKLNIEGVPHIFSADAFIYPDSGRVDILRGGVMEKFENARIVADTINRYHVINKAKVEVLGRRVYRASGFYEYNIGGREQEIELQDISGQPVGKGQWSEKKAETRAEGQVSPEDSFYIDQKTLFQGKISLNAASKNLHFDGFAKLDAEKLPARYWFTVSSEGDKKDLAIRFENPRSFDGEPLETGLFLSKETSRIYPRAMMPLLFRKDRPILPVKGVFKYDKNKDWFIFGDSSKVLTPGLKGNVLTFKNRDGSVEAEGRFNIGSGLKYLKVDAAGFAKTVFPPPPPEVDPNIMLAEDTLAADQPTVQESPLTAELMTGIQMIVPDQLLKIMITDIKASSFDAKNITLLTDLNFYQKAATEIFPPTEEVREAITGISSGFLDVQSKFNPYTFLFSRLKLKWDPDYQSFVTTDDKIGLVSVAGESINKVLTCYVEFKMPSNEDDRLYIYLKSPSELFYFFGYKQGILSITSNNPAFMEALDGLKAKDLVLKMEDGETYEIQSVEPGSANLFLRRIQAVNK